MNNQCDHIPGGFILLARKMLDSEFMDKPPLWHKLWNFMLLKASAKPYKGLSPGQFYTSISEMREAMSHTVGYRRETPTARQIRRAYEGFAKGSMIVTTKVTRGLLVTICNYTHYQDFKSYEGHNEGHNERTTKGPRMVTLYNKQTEQTEQNKKPLSQTCDETVSENQEKPIKGSVPKSYHPEFERFWLAYPKRQGRRNGKRTAFSVWWRYVRDGIVTNELLIERISVLAPSYGEYPKDPATWLRAYGWQDEFDEASASGQASKTDISLGVLECDGPAKYKDYCQRHGLPLDMASMAKYAKGGDGGLRKFC